MEANRPQQISALGPLAALLGMGILGIILFAVLLVLLAPLLIVVVIWLSIKRWQFRRALRKACEQAQEETDYAQRPRKHVDVTVHPADE